eukprot:6197663-Pleurochrysis_carterae.AAC.2
MPNTRVWVRDSSDEWVLGEQLSAAVDGGNCVVRLPFGAELTLDSPPPLANDCGHDADADLAMLAHVEEPSLLHALSERFKRDEIYTWCGSVLVAINPWKPLPHLYTDRILAEYMTKDSQRSSGPEQAPHAYAIAKNALAELQREAEPQTARVGSTGDGKADERSDGGEGVTKTFSTRADEKEDDSVVVSGLLAKRSSSRLSGERTTRAHDKLYVSILISGEVRHARQFVADALRDFMMLGPFRVDKLPDLYRSFYIQSTKCLQRRSTYRADMFCVRSRARGKRRRQRRCFTTSARALFQNDENRYMGHSQRLPMHVPL